MPSSARLMLSLFVSRLDGFNQLFLCLFHRRKLDASLLNQARCGLGYISCGGKDFNPLIDARKAGKVNISPNTQADQLLRILRLLQDSCRPCEIDE